MPISLRRIMKLIGNINSLLSDDLKNTLLPKSKLKIAASCFSIYVYEALKKELSKIDSLQFIFTSPTFVSGEVTDKFRKETIDADKENANPEEAVCLHLTPDLDIGRGEILTTVDTPLEISDRLAAGLIQHSLQSSNNVFGHNFEINQATLAKQKGQKPCVLWFTGLSASGKSTLANLVAKELFSMGKHVYILDGDNLRHGLNKNLGFSQEDRTENIRRAGAVAQLMVDAGLIVLATFISPFRADREQVQQLFKEGEYHEIFVDTPLEVCVQRDPKGLYKQALSGRISNFTGISSPFEAPEKPTLCLDGTLPPDKLVNDIIALIKGP